MKEQTKKTVLNMISDHVIWTRLYEAIEGVMNITAHDGNKQGFDPYKDYVGLDNVFFVMNLTDDIDPGYNLRDYLVTVFVELSEAQRKQKYDEVAENIFNEWLKRLGWQ